MAVMRPDRLLARLKLLKCRAMIGQPVGMAACVVTMSMMAVFMGEINRWLLISFNIAFRLICRLDLIDGMKMLIPSVSMVKLMLVLIRVPKECAGMTLLALICIARVARLFDVSAGRFLHRPPLAEE